MQVSNPILDLVDPIVHPDVQLFVIDTETTGSVGIPFWNSRNVIIQLCIMDIECKDIFNKYTKPSENLDDLVIPLENLQKHKISKQTIQNEGYLVSEVLDESRNFKNKRNGKKIVNIGHNVEFDYNMIMKTHYTARGESFGRGCEEDEEYYFDTLKCFKDLYPEIGKIFFARDAPYRLSSLVQYLIPVVNMEGAHNAMVDVIATSILFTKFLYPRMPKSFEQWGKWLVSHPLRNSHPSATLVKDISGFGAGRVYKLNTACKQLFQSFVSEDIKNLCVPDGLFTANYLLHYAYVKLSEHCRFHDQSDTWLLICQELEMLLRKELDIYSDKIIVSLLSKVCNCTELDFVFHTYRELENKLLFPSLPGTAISFLPMQISDEEAQQIMKVFGCRTISELYADRKFTHDSSSRRWFLKLNECLLEPLGFEEIQEIFENVIKFGG